MVLPWPEGSAGALEGSPLAVSELQQTPTHCANERKRARKTTKVNSAPFRVETFPHNIAADSASFVTLIVAAFPLN